MPKIDDEAFSIAVSRNSSIAGILRELGLRPAGANYAMVHRRVRNLNLVTDHWTGQGHLRGRTHDWMKKTPLREILTAATTYRGATSALKARLIRAGLLQPRCATCGITDWQNKVLAFHLDHVNGDNADNRLTNLRILCPNCHSQTPTYCGRNKGRAGRVVGRTCATRSSAGER